MEIFKPIPDYEGLYEASNFGNIKSLKSKHNKIIVLKKSKDRSGYEIVQLCKDGHHSTKTVHRLVMTAFYGLSNMVVNHIDGIKSNNNIENLEYVSSSENSRHAIENKLWIPNTFKIAESKRKKVLMICPESNQILNTFESAHDAAKQTGFNRGNISTGCRLNKIFYGRKWQYGS
jgi:hypothetical protein